VFCSTMCSRVSTSYIDGGLAPIDMLIGRTKFNTTLINPWNDSFSSWLISSFCNVQKCLFYFNKQKNNSILRINKHFSNKRETSYRYFICACFSFFFDTFTNDGLISVV